MLAIFHAPASTSVRDIYIGTLSRSLWIALLLTWLLVYCSYLMLSFFNHLDLASDVMECFLVIIASISEQGKPAMSIQEYILFYKTYKNVCLVAIESLAFQDGINVEDVYRALF